MKRELFTAGIVFLSLLAPVKASAANFSQIFVFGDSFVDTGNVFQATRNTTGIGFPSSPPYFEGRFANGPVWVDYLSSSLGLNQTNFAFGGATTGRGNTIEKNFNLEFPGLQEQIENFTAANPAADSNALYIVSAGGSDYLSAGVTNPTEPVNNLINGIKSLAAVGARNILVSNVLDLGKLPATNKNPEISSQLNGLTQIHNSLLRTRLTDLSQQLGIKITPLDTSSILNRRFNNPSEFGLTNVTDACLNLNAGTICSNPNEFAFWDNTHPTTRVHRILAEVALSAVQTQSVPRPTAAIPPRSVPEPSTMLALLALGAVSVVGTLQHQHKKLVPSPIFCRMR
ncbi:hypothetical protein BZZ01_23785 [Nostocales cyanobacterium HT-58-2]|nr:hypothetical protein BZZ01_23785 [Nostocales cyanobacterium HT-58-2]